MRQLSGWSIVLGGVFASIFWGLLIFALNFETRLPQEQIGLNSRYQIYESAITENDRIFDDQTKRTIIWTPGNPKNAVSSIEEIREGEWKIIIKKIY